MKIIVENTTFPYDLGCRLLKLKNGNVCPFPQLEDIWNDIEPITFKEIAKLENLEQRRVGIVCLGLEKLIKEVKPKLLNKQTIKKTTTWINKNGDLENKTFDDTYELYQVDGSYFSEGLEQFQRMGDSYFVKCKDTSTDREYLLWVDLLNVYITNNAENGKFGYGFATNKVNAIQCIAWTIQTNIQEGNIEKILRQGDCILIKPKDKSVAVLNEARHLTEKEYRNLIVAES